MRKYKYYLIVLISILIVIVVNTLTTYKERSVKTNSNYSIEGLGFYIKEKNGDIVKELDINKIDSYEFVLINNSPSDKELCLSILYGYIQEDFKIENEIMNVYNFVIKSHNEIVLPVKLLEKLNTENYNNYIFTFVENKNKELKKELNYTFTVKVKNEDNNQVNYPIENKISNIAYEEFEFDGLNIIPDVNVEDEEYISINTDKVNIPITLGGGDSSDYLVYCLVNGKQEYIDGNLIKRYKIKEKHAIKDNIEISLESKGLNQLRLYIVENPESLDLKSYQIETSKTLNFFREEQNE